MDCKLARERLDAARPDSRDREDPELLAAFAHLDDCAACAEANEFRSVFDRQIGAVVRSVEVPADLRSRLLASLASSSAPAPRPADAEKPRPSRRRAIMAAASAATLMIAAGWTWWAAHRQPAPLAAATVLDWCRTNLAEHDGAGAPQLAPFDNSFVASVGDGRWASRLTDDSPRGADLDGDGWHDAAVYSFRGGLLVVLPPDRVTDPPAAASASNAQKQYSPAPHVAWTLNRQMYVCFLPSGDSNQLDTLLRQVYRSAA